MPPSKADPATSPARRLPFEVRQEQLVDVAEELFVAHGYAAVTMEDIARAAGVTRPIVYRHFETREGAYLACVRRARDAYQARMVERVAAAGSPREQLAAGGSVFFEMLEENRGRWMLLFGGEAVLPGEYTKDLAKIRFGTIRLIHAQLKAAAPGAPAVEVEAAANAVSGVGERLGYWWLSRPDVPRQQVVDLFVELLWSGIGRYVEEP